MSDAFDFAGDVRRLLGDPALDEFESRGEPSELAKGVAAQLAAAIGRCRLFGVDLGEDDGTFLPRMAIGAAEAALGWCEVAKDMATTLPSQWLGMPDEFFADSLAADLLEARMDLWAVEVTLSEAALAAMADAEALAEELNAILDRLSSAVDELDAILRQDGVRVVLSTIADMPLLENWRRMLVPPYSKAIPFWLEGSFLRGSEMLN